MTFNPSDHVIIMERKSKQKDAQGHETWKVTKTEYLPVQWRLYWFRLENQKGKIDSKALTIDLEKGAAIFETYVEREDGGSARMHGSETASDWKDYIEKAQTKSLGRALAAVGYGSQFTDDEFAEGERIVDSPVARQNGHVDAPDAAPKSSPSQSNSPIAAALEKLQNRALFAKIIEKKSDWWPWLNSKGIIEVRDGKDLGKINEIITALEKSTPAAGGGR